MEESNEIKKLYGFLQGIIYLFVFLEVFNFLLFKVWDYDIIRQIVLKFNHTWIFGNLLHSKIFIFLFTIVVSIGTKAKKNINFNFVKHVYFPLITGILFIIFSVLCYKYNFGAVLYKNLQLSHFLYAFLTIAGAVFTHVAFDNISKFIKSKLMDDKFNIENESFEQNKTFVANESSVNLPMQYYYQKKIHNGWINVVNPFRGSLVLGTPGSGKTFSVIIPYIKQLLRKGFTALIYDFKYPDLGKIAYYHYLVNKKQKKIPDNFKFHVINISNVAYSRRVNPLKPEYLENMAQCAETAEALLKALQKTDKSTGADQFFTQSAINFLSAVLYFFKEYENGKYSTLPHVLSFINHGYEDIFNVLRTMPELNSFLSPFKTAFKNKAFDQLEGQLGTLKINLSRLSSKESYWIFSGDDVELKISDPNNPSCVIIANDPKTQNINSALNALVLNRITQLVNSSGNLPCLIAVDELPTIFFHKISSLIATARSRKVAVILGIQELPQLVELYNREIADTIVSIIGNVFSGSVRKKETLDWLEKLFGKVKQVRQGMNVDRNKTSFSYSEYLDNLIPASKISNLNTGEIVAQIANFKDSNDHKFQVNSFNCRINLNAKKITKEEQQYVNLPKFYNFGQNDENINAFLTDNFMQIEDDVTFIIRQIVLNKAV